MASRRPACPSPTTSALLASAGAAAVATVATATASAAAARLVVRESPRKLKRQALVGAGVEGALALSIALATRKRHQVFAGAMAYVGLAALGMGGLALLMPDEAWDRAALAPRQNPVVRAGLGALARVAAGALVAV